MIYICSEIEPSYTLDCEHEIIDNNLCSLSDQYRHMRGIWQLYNRTELPDEIGIFQKRRALPVMAMPEHFDVVVPECDGPCVMRDQYIECAPYANIAYPERDFDLIEHIIAEQSFSEYIRMPNNFECYWHNVFIMRKNDFKRYCEFVFDVLFEKDRHVGPQDDCFLAERIGSYWIWKNFDRDKICTCSIVEFQKFN